MMKFRTLTFLILMVAAPFVGAVVITTPGGNAGVEGDSNNGFPFNFGGNYYQQVYDASLFGGATGAISEIRFRVDGGDPGFSADLGLEIILSHTSAGPGSLSNTFADNLGGDATTVLNGVVTLSGTGGPGPNPFDVVLDIANSFVYNGTDNLLLQVRRLSGSTGVQFDSVRNAPGSELMNRVWNDDVNAASGSSGGDTGLVTQFVIGDANPVPTPSTLALAMLGLVAVRRRANI